MRIAEVTSRPIPTRSFSELFHIGTLNRAHKRPDSLEGPGLSVSLHPEEWMQIAEIGGPIWRCRRPGNKFINFVRLNKQHRTMIGDWAIDHGLALRTSLWRVDYTDDDGSRYMMFQERDKAQAEVDDLEDATITEVKGALMGTPTLYQQMMQSRHEPSLVDDLIAIRYAEDVLKIDGVWWQEQLDVEALSAPRGVIVPSMISHWRFDAFEDVNGRL